MVKNGVILAGGNGTRLAPLTQIVNKGLLGVNGKFVIDYPIQTLKQMGCENVTVVLGGSHFSQIVGYLQDGSRYGLNLNYVFQDAPRGIAQAISLCKRFVDQENFTVILADNIYEDPIEWTNSSVAQIVLADHPELNRFGVASFDSFGDIKAIQEKPQVLDTTLSHLAITGCYRFTPEYFEFFKELKPSKRNEYEITSIIQKYHDTNKLSWTKINNLWSDAGEHNSIAYLNNYFYNKKAH